MRACRTDIGPLAGIGLPAWYLGNLGAEQVAVGLHLGCHCRRRMPDQGSYPPERQTLSQAFLDVSPIIQIQSLVTTHLATSLSLKAGREPEVAAKGILLEQWLQD